MEKVQTTRSVVADATEIQVHFIHLPIWARRNLAHLAPIQRTALVSHFHRVPLFSKVETKTNK